MQRGQGIEGGNFCELIENCLRVSSGLRTARNGSGTRGKKTDARSKLSKKISGSKTQTSGNEQNHRKQSENRGVLGALGKKENSFLSYADLSQERMGWKGMRWGAVRRATNLAEKKCGGTLDQPTNWYKGEKKEKILIKKTRGGRRGANLSFWSKEGKIASQTCH